MAQKPFMDLAAHPQAILDAMDVMRAAIERIERQQKWITPINILRWALIILGFILVFIMPNVLVGILMIVIPILSFFVYRPKRFPARTRFEAAYQVIHTLRDDAGRKGHLVGHLDLSPPDQKTKLLRTGRTSHGNTKYYYRDPWFVAKLKLVDGNVVKLLLEDRVKVKKGTFSYHHTNWENKVMVNSRIYQAADRYDPANPPIMIGAGQLDPKNLHVESMLGDLRAIYAQVRPVEPAGPTPAFDALPPDAPSPPVGSPSTSDAAPPESAATVPPAVA